MKQPIDFLEAAARDVEEIVAHYEEKQAGLGLEWMDELETLLTAMEYQPQSFDPVDQIHRRGLISRFPYVVYFRAEASRLVVMAVIHSARHPRHWRKRLH